ncbi:MAG: site-specific DNA-methyltransferase [Dysgonamonadaceae bacterium]|jgi:site-specific DNA-methyltransferase (adenine-specific)|nr:site-specific DNA-methyltransferase [Dysgonamonadaceae bacterium]
MEYKTEVQQPDLLPEPSVAYIAANEMQRSIEPVYKTSDTALYNNDCLDIMNLLPDNYIDMIFADPPYNLSNDGITCHAGKMVSVNKGKWDKSNGFENDVEFHEKWISECRRILKPEGTIWISGTNHSIYQCGFLLQKLKFHILNDISWFKPNAAPNLACTTFAHSHETLLWAKKDKKAKHIFNYEKMKNGIFNEDKMKVPDKQMRSVWSIPTPSPDEKIFGKHPTQKPLALLKRIVVASTNEGCLIVDPFNGGGTTGVAAKIVGNREYIGIDIEKEYIDLTINRLNQINTQNTLFSNEQ